MNKNAFKLTLIISLFLCFVVSIGGCTPFPCLSGEKACYREQREFDTVKTVFAACVEANDPCPDEKKCKDGSFIKGSCCPEESALCPTSIGGSVCYDPATKCCISDGEVSKLVEKCGTGCCNAGYPFCRQGECQMCPLGKLKCGTYCYDPIQSCCYDNQIGCQQGWECENSGGYAYAHCVPTPCTSPLQACGTQCIDNSCCTNNQPGCVGDAMAPKCCKDGTCQDCTCTAPEVLCGAATNQQSCYNPAKQCCTDGKAGDAGCAARYCPSNDYEECKHYKCEPGSSAMVPAQCTWVA